MKLRTYLILVSILALGWNGYSQKGNIKKAIKDYDKFSYIKTSDILLQVAERGYESADLFEKLGNAFYFNNKMDEAANWYAKLMDMNRPVDPELFYRYAQALKFSEKYDESDKWMERFADARSDELRARGFLSKRDYLESIESLSETFAVTIPNGPTLVRTNTRINSFLPPQETQMKRPITGMNSLFLSCIQQPNKKMVHMPELRSLTTR